jgi:DNA-3-methyladenine glycosylase II
MTSAFPEPALTEPALTEPALTKAMAHLRSIDPILAVLIDRIGPCTLAAVSQGPNSGDLLAVLAESILHQQLSTKVAQVIHQRFLTLFPEGLTAQTLLETPAETLRSVGLSRQKIAYLHSLAHHSSVGLPSLKALADLDDEAIIQVLTPIRGVGRWTVQMLLMFRLLRPDVLPVDDLGIRTAIQRLYGLAELPKAKAMTAIAAPWQPWRTVACWYLWRSLEPSK